MLKDGEKSQVQGQNYCFDFEGHTKDPNCMKSTLEEYVKGDAACIHSPSLIMFFPINIYSVI